MPSGHTSFGERDPESRAGRRHGAARQVAGYAQSKDWKTITDFSKVNKGPQAREDFQGKPIPISKSKRGNPVSGTPLTAADLVGSRPKQFA